MHQKNTTQVAFLKWLPFAVIILVFAGLVEVAVQQNYRMSANDPQIQVAEDVAFAVTHGQATPDSIVPATPTTDMTASLSTFLMIYNATGTPMGGSVGLDGKVPTPPAGVFDATKQHGEYRFTWQPKPGVRIAAVVTQYTGPQSGFVLVGRSLREVEIRETNLEIMTGVAALLALVLTFLLIMYLVKMGEMGHKHSAEETAETVAPDYHHEHEHHPHH